MTAWLAYREIQILIPQVMKKYDVPMPPPEVAGEIVPIDLQALLEDEDLSEDEQERLLEIARREIRRQQRTEYEALEEAIPDLIRLERYERRAWSRQKSAIREFLNLKFTREILLARGRPKEVARASLDSALRWPTLMKLSRSTSRCALELARKETT